MNLNQIKIKELEDVVRKTTQLTPANQIAEDRDDKIIQLQKELNERTRDLEDKTSQNAKPTKKE